MKRRANDPLLHLKNRATVRFKWALHRGGLRRPEAMKEELRRIAWDETSRLRPGDLFELARRYCELRFRPGEVYADFMEAGQAKEEAVRERLYEMLRDQLQTYLRQARGGEPLKIRIQVRRHSISIAGVGERPTGPDPKTHSGTLGRRP